VSPFEKRIWAIGMGVQGLVVSGDAVMKQQAEKKHRARVEKLLKKLRSL
jgi:hypothetical protein